MEHKNPQTSTVQPPSSSYSAANRTSHWFIEHNCINENEKTFVLEDVDFDRVIVHVPDALHEEAPLQAEGSQE